MRAPSRQFEAVHIVQRMQPGGIETMVLDLLAYGTGEEAIFSLEGTVADLVRAWPALASLEGRLFAFDKAEGKDPRLVLRLARQLRRCRPEAVFLHHIGPLLYGGVAGRLARIRRIVHVEHEVWQYGGADHATGQARRTLARRAFRLIRPHHIAVSGQVAETLRQVSPGGEISIIHPGVRLNKFQLGERSAARRRLGLPDASRIVGTVGRLSPEKGQVHLLRAIAQLPSDVELVLVGSGPLEQQLRDEARRLGIQARVHFLGHRDDIEAILPAFDLFCLPSLNEGLPRTILEAQACGLMVVASRTGGIAEAVSSQTGIIVPAAADRMLAEAITDVLQRRTDPILVRRFIEQHFSMETVAQAYQAFAQT